MIGIYHRFVKQHPPWLLRGNKKLQREQLKEDDEKADGGNSYHIHRKYLILRIMCGILK